nr:hypothetical protein [Enhygromyxa salina]
MVFSIRFAMEGLYHDDTARVAVDCAADRLVPRKLDFMHSVNQTEVEQQDLIFLVMDDLAELAPELGSLGFVEARQEHRILHRLAKVTNYRVDPA